MAGKVRLLTGPRGAGKTTALLSEARKLVAGDPGSVLWLVPTKLALSQLRCHIARTGSIGGLRCATLGELVDSIVEGQDEGWLSDAQRRLLAEEVASEAAAARQLQHYAGVAEAGGFLDGLLGMIAELREAGIGPAALARAAYRRDPESTPAVMITAKAKIRRDDRERARLYARYQQQLTRLGAGDNFSREAGAVQLLKDSRSPLLEGVQTVILDGFIDFTPGQFALLEALRARSEAVWISLPDEQATDRGEIFSRPRNTAGRLSLHVDRRHQLSPPDDRPAGLGHLARELFRPLRHVQQSSIGAGIELIEAPGLVGEVRLVARRIRLLLAEGTPPDEILFVAREISLYADLVTEIFAEYDIPAAVEGQVPLPRYPGVAILLRAMRLPEDDFPFAGLTALLRHGHFRPQWPEVDAPDVPLLSEALLRLLGEPRGQSAYTAAVERWAEAPPPALEDESAEQSRRLRTHELAKRCRAFLTRLFAAFANAPARAPLAEHVAWLRRLADDLGITRTAEQDAADRSAWELLWDEIASWQRRVERSTMDVMPRHVFVRRLGAVAAHASLPRCTSDAGRVRVLGALSARHLSARSVFLVGLGERAFPKVGAKVSLLAEEDRAALARAGLSLGGADPLADEMLLFLQIVTSARESLVLSYPAVDERGQDLLPGSFLLAVTACFVEGAIPTERRSMLLENFDRARPLSMAEYRVRVGAAWPLGSNRLPDEVRANLFDAAEMARRRFVEPHFTPHDGLFADPLLIDWVGRLFGRERIFSPTALEDYVSCPFRFLLRHVMHLEPLDEPSEEVEVTRRGMTYHRALARLHQRLRDSGLHRPAPGVQEEVQREMERAVGEDVARAAGPASQALWRLEGERLMRSAGRYPDQWLGFLEPWDKVGVTPRPHLFEADFGLPVAEGKPALPPLVIRTGDVEVRISGRIDRIDVAQLDDGMGFWIIDYKTGRSGNYTGTDLAQFRKLQLTLYACAVEAVFLGDQPARPLGLAYWLVSDSGIKVALPGRNVAAWRDDPKRWPAVRSALQQWLAQLAQQIRKGAFPLAPRSLDCTQSCPYGPVCRIGQSRSTGKVFDLPLPGSEVSP